MVTTPVGFEFNPSSTIYHPVLVIEAETMAEQLLNVIH